MAHCKLCTHAIIYLYSHSALHIQHRFTKELCWVHGLYNFPWVAEDLTARALAQAQDRNAAITISAFVVSLRDCARNKDLCRGARVHDDMLKSGYVEKCSDALLTMYAKCGELAKARELLDIYKSRNVCTWNALISAYVQKGQAQDALGYFDRMQLDGIHPDVVTFSCILKACASLRASDKGEEIHDQIARQGLLQNNIILGTSLIDMYAKCGALIKARRVLEALPVRNAFSWSAMIAGYAQHGEGQQALTCLKKMQGEGLCPDAVTFTCILKACGSIGATDEGEKIHDVIAKQGIFRSDLVLGTALIDMYAKCGALSKARQALNELAVRNVVSWNALIAGNVQHGKCEEALSCFRQMELEGFSPTAATFSCMLKACSNMRVVDTGEQIYEKISRQGFLEKNIILGNALVDMYAKCGALEKAAQVLKQLPVRNVVSWSTLIGGYAQQGRAQQALSCFEQMKCEGLSPNGVTFICLLRVCGSIGAADEGGKIHDEIAKLGLLKDDITLGNALVSMYARCGTFAKARQVLEELPVRNVISWNALIAGYAKHYEADQALICFEQMQHEDLSPDAVTFICILKACGDVGAIDKGEEIHDKIAKQGLLDYNIVLGTALVDMYSKCGALGKARGVFEELPVRNVVSWNALITGSVKHGEAEQALSSFEQLQYEGFYPDAATFSCLLSACSRSGLLNEGHMHFSSMSAKYGLKPGLEHYSSMIDLFGRTGHLDKAAGIMEKMPSFYVEGWSTLLGVCRKWEGVNVGSWAFEHAVK